MQNVKDNKVKVFKIDCGREYKLWNEFKSFCDQQCINM
jgi:hypothetical protein